MTNPSQPIAELSWFDAEGRIHETPLEPGLLWNNSGSRWISDELGIEFNLEAEETELLRTARLSRDSIREHGRNRLRTITLLPSRLAAAEGEDAAILLPCDLGVLCKTSGKVPAEHILPGFCAKEWPPYVMSTLTTVLLKGKSARSMIVDGAELHAELRLRTNWGENGEYSVAAVFHLRETPDELLTVESPSVRIQTFPEGIASLLKGCRADLMTRKHFVPLAEKAAERPEIAESARSICIRMRMATKPVPSPIPEQTPENEPEVRVLMTFDDAIRIADECAANGIKHLDFTFVGWNRGGHDGAYPQLFPVEEKIGGEEAMRRAIRHIQSLGYRVGVHDNYIDTYTLADNLDRSDWMFDSAGNPVTGECWGGGRAYLCCPERALQHYLPENLTKLKSFGLDGAYYVDVISLLNLRPCCNPAHPLTLEQAAVCYKKILKTQHDFTGVSMSEGIREWSMPEVDRAYAIGNTPETHCDLPFADETFPLVPMLFHGFVLYNACRTTINARPGTEAYLQNIAAGGLPLIYFYQRFRLCADPLNSRSDDFLVSPPEILRREGIILKRIADDTKRLAPLQMLFLNGFTRLSTALSRTEFEDGSSLYVNWSDETAFTPEDLPVPAKDFLVVRQARQEN